MVMSLGWNPYYKNEKRSAVKNRMNEEGGDTSATDGDTD
jgi:hypothetical protein